MTIIERAAQQGAEITRLRSALHLIASQKHLDPIWTTFARKTLEEPSHDDQADAIERGEVNSRR